MDTAQSLGNFGSKYTLDWRGRTWKFAFISDWEKSWYENWMKQSLMEEIALDTLSTESQKSDDRIRVRESIRAGEFRWGSEKWGKVRNTPEGRVRIFWMLLAKNHPELQRNDIENMLLEESERCMCILTLISVDSLLEGGDPKDGKAQVALSEVYAKLTQPPEAGGMGIPIEIVAQYTDRQKMEQLNRNLQSESVKPTRGPDTKQLESMAETLRAYAAKTAA